MNAEIIYKQNVKDSVLDKLVKELPVIIAETMEGLGGMWQFSNQNRSC